jgi:hypothetical protein
MKRFLIGTICAACTIFGFTPIATAEKWAPVTTSEYDGRTYLIDLDSRAPYISKTGWRHVTFKISSGEDKYSYSAIAACDPFQLYVPAYSWDWEPDKKSYSVYTVGGKLARAACNW